MATQLSLAQWADHSLRMDLAATSGSTPSPTSSESTSSTVTPVPTEMVSDQSGGGPSLTFSSLLLVLIPLLIGAALTLFVEWLKNKNAKDKDVRDEDARIAEEAREEERQKERSRRLREEQAAEHVDRMFSALARDLWERQTDLGADEEISKRDIRILQAFDEISAQVAYLPKELGDRLAQLVPLMQFGDEVGSSLIGGFHYHGVHRVLERTATEAHRLIAAFLRREALPQTSAIIEEYLVALREVMDQRRSEYAQEIHEGEEERAAWRTAHPDFHPSPGAPEDDDL